MSLRRPTLAALSLTSLALSAAVPDDFEPLDRGDDLSQFALVGIEEGMISVKDDEA
jgi:hypothetical protein